MPQNLAIAEFVFGATLLLIALLGGRFKIFGAEIPERVGVGIRVVAGVIGGILILWACRIEYMEKFGPRSGEMFELTVRAHSADGSNPLIANGTITIDFGSDRRTESLGVNGEADFKNVPRKFKDSTLNVLPKVEGYEEQWQQYKLTSDVLNLALVRKAPSTTRLVGSIDPPPAKGRHTIITADGLTEDTSPDALGRFELPVNGKSGGRIRLKIYVDGKLEYDDFQVLPGPITVKLHKKR